MKYVIVADSSADLAKIDISSEAFDLKSVPLKIITSEEEYVDDSELNVEQMVSELESYKGRSSSSCPNTSDWLNAFSNADLVFCITITSGLSGSYNSACAAAKVYEGEHPERRVKVIDSLSTGPEMALIVDRLTEYINDGKSFDQICSDSEEYQKKTGLIFMLESMRNLANNGRVNPIVAKLAGVLGIRVIGKASDVGTLEQLEKCRGEDKALHAIVEQMVSLGYHGGKVKIADCLNPNAVVKLKSIINKLFSNALVDTYQCRGLCSFYAERGGILVGFEKG